MRSSLVCACAEAQAHNTTTARGKKRAIRLLLRGLKRDVVVANNPPGGSAASLLLLLLVVARRAVRVGRLLLNAAAAAATTPRQRLANLHRRRAQRLDLLLERCNVVALGRVARLPERRVDLIDHCRRYLILVLRQRLLRRVDRRVGLVLGLDHLLARPVGSRELLGVAYHRVDLLVGQAAARLDAD
mmetsp:Transcript_39551/g.117640  ORF Transcript_39551/g.117640 Transcript_39551/m.117640 type:complete len:187 (+) Transcript_39551:51-611(+)